MNEPGGTRTHDPLIKSQLLYQLSYGLAKSLPEQPGVLPPISTNRAG